MWCKICSLHFLIYLMNNKSSIQYRQYFPMNYIQFVVGCQYVHARCTQQTCKHVLWVCS